MDIQATISALQRQLKYNADFIHNEEQNVKYWLKEAKSGKDGKYAWRKYHYYKDDLQFAVNQQKMAKSLYKLMCTIQKQMPNGSISMAQIREM